MKTKIITTTVLFLAISLSVLAGEKNKSSLLSTSHVSIKECQFCINEYRNNIVEFRMLKANDDKITLKVYSDTGVKIYHRNFKKANGLELDCDLSKLRDGQYTFVIEKDKKVILSKVFTK